jgi:hypothetical protein
MLEVIFKKIRIYKMYINKNFTIFFTKELRVLKC